MARLQFEMWRYEHKPGEYDGYISQFTDGKGQATESYWSSPPSSIDHVGPEYLCSNYRHPNARTKRHDDFIKRRFKEEMSILKPTV